MVSFHLKCGQYKPKHYSPANTHASIPKALCTLREDMEESLEDGILAWRRLVGEKQPPHSVDARLVDIVTTPVEVKLCKNK